MTRLKSVSLSITPWTLVKAVTVYWIGSLVEYVIQNSFYTEFVGLRPLLLFGYEISRSAIVALVVFGLSVVSSYLIKDFVAKKLLNKSNAPRVGTIAVLLLVFISIFVGLSGLLNGYMVLERLKGSEISLEPWVQIAVLGLMVLGSWLSLVVASIAGAIVMVLQPILKVSRKRNRVIRKLERAKTALKEFESKLEHSQILFPEIEFAIYEQVKINTMDKSKVDIKDFLNFLNKDKND